MALQEEINNFLSLKTFTIAGASRTGKKFGNSILKEMKSRNYKIFPVHFDAETIDGEKCYKDFASLPEPAEGLIISVNKKKTLEILRNAYNSGIENVWIQLMSDSKEALEYCRENNINVISKECILMHLEPVKGFHKFHKFLRRLFGKYPK
jgi:uncharacterized protein